MGLGTVMLIKLLQLAKKDGMHRIALHVVADNKRAVHLYEKLGFKIEGFFERFVFWRRQAISSGTCDGLDA